MEYTDDTASEFWKLSKQKGKEICMSISKQ